MNKWGWKENDAITKHETMEFRLLKMAKLRDD